MSEPILKHEVAHFPVGRPFNIIIIRDTRVDDPSFLPHWHEELELVYSYGGTAVSFIDGREYHTAKNDLIVMNPNSIHSIQPSVGKAENHQILAVVMQVQKEFLKQILPEVDVLRFSNDNLHMDDTMLSIIHQIIQETDKPAHDASIFDNLYVKGLMMQLIGYVGKTRLEKIGTETPINVQKNIERLRGVLQYIELHYTEQILQTDVAKKFYFNPDYFSRFFHKNMGMSFLDYLTDYRITKAMDQLVGSSETILNIALANGFPDGRAYTNAFRKRYNQTPLHYRSAYRNT